MTTVRPARRMSPAARREQLLGAAMELFAHRAYDQVSVDDITAAADVSRALFYRYFSSTWEIYVAVAQSGLDTLTERMTAPSEGPLAEQLRHAIGEFVSFAVDHPAAFNALLRNGPSVASSETDALVNAVRQRVVDEVVTRAGITEPSPVLLTVVRGWIALVETSTLIWLREGFVPRETLVVLLGDQLIAMISVTAAHDPATAAILDQLLAKMTTLP